MFSEAQKYKIFMFRQDNAQENKKYSGQKNKTY